MQVTNGADAANDLRTGSARLYARASRFLPGGCSRNTILREPHPIYAKEGRGYELIDVDGNHYIDFANNMASLIHGHAHPELVAAVTRQLRKGTAFMMATEAELQFAEHMCSRCDGFDQIRFMNSGTEAVMNGIKAARAFTGRAKIAKAEGAYHGVYDYAEVSQTSSPENWGSVVCPNSNPVAKGTPGKALSDVVVFPFNDTDHAERILNRHAHELACVLVDPVPHRVGLIPAQPEFLKMLRDWTRTNGALLLFDEVVTFRTSTGGAQEAYGIRPDLTALGKMIGGGFPIGALAGNLNAMSVMDPAKKPVRLPQAGTFSANPISMTAGLVAMRLLDADAVANLNALGERLRVNLLQAADLASVPVTVTGFASMFRIHVKEIAPENYREAYASAEENRLLKRILDALLERGYSLVGTGTGTLSTPMNPSVVDRFTQQCLEIFREL